MHAGRATSDVVDQLHWTVVGAGSIGRRHLRNLRALGARRVTAVRRGGQPLDGDLAAIPVLADLMPATDAASAVVLCVPTAGHAEAGARALAAGHHLLVEKPAARTPDEARALERAARDAGRVASVATCLRFHPVLEALRTVLASGPLGRVHWAAVWCGLHLADWRPGQDYHAGYSAHRDQGGGVLLDLIHEIDYLHWLFGDAGLIGASVGDGSRLGIDAEEQADLLLQFRDGPAVSCHLDALSRPGLRGGQLAADRGQARWDLRGPSLELRLAGERDWTPVALPDGWSLDDMYRDELRAFAAHVRGEGPNPSPLSEAVRALETVAAARVTGEGGPC